MSESKKQEFTLQLYWDDLSKNFELYASKGLATQYTILIGPVTVEVEVPQNFDVRTARLNAIREQETQLRAEFQKRLTELQRQAQELMAIEMEVSE